MTSPLSDFVLLEPLERVDAFLAAIEAGRLGLGSTRASLQYAFVHSPGSLERMAGLLAWWRAQVGEGTEPLLASSLRALQEVRRGSEERGPSCELVWTGEGEGAPGVRATTPVVLEMLGRARRTVLVVAYSVWLRGGHALDVLARMAALGSQGVEVTFVVDAAYRDGHSIREIQQKWPAGARRPDLWSWSNPDDQVAKLHAKVLLVDGNDLLVTSANLTGHGLGENLEIGLRVIGRPARTADDHFRSLLRNGHFDAVAWD